MYAFIPPNNDYESTKAILGFTMMNIWGWRLCLYLLYRNWNKGEDFRYQAFRSASPRYYWIISYFQVFILQGLLAWGISMPLLGIFQYQANYTQYIKAFDWIGFGLWVVGFFFEAVGDFQLMLFKKNPANQGKVLNTGLWRYTRHPNYFGESLMGWGIYLLACTTGMWWSIYAPILMTSLLLWVSGVAMLDRGLSERKPGYREYIESTPAFLPWFPRRVSPSNEEAKSDDDLIQRRSTSATADVDKKDSVSSSSMDPLIQEPKRRVNT